MKHLKIFSAVLLFSFVGSMQNQLSAQLAGGYWNTFLSNEGELNNLSYTVKVQNDEKNKHEIKLVVSKKNTVVKSLLLSDDRRNGAFQSMKIEKDDNDNVVLRIETEGNTVDIDLSVEGRKKMTDGKYKVLDTEKEVHKSAYFQVESADGRVVVYHGTVGLLGSKGTPILEFVEKQ
jgi:hypothetical protein